MKLLSTSRIGIPLTLFISPFPFPFPFPLSLSPFPFPLPFLFKFLSFTHFYKKISLPPFNFPFSFHLYSIPFLSPFPFIFPFSPDFPFNLLYHYYPAVQWWLLYNLWNILRNLRVNYLYATHGSRRHVQNFKKYGSRQNILDEEETEPCLKSSLFSGLG